MLTASSRMIGLGDAAGRVGNDHPDRTVGIAGGARAARDERRAAIAVTPEPAGV